MSAYEGSYFAQGLRLMGVGDYAGAAARFKDALKLGLGNLAEIHACLGQAQACLGDWGAAEASVKAALRLEPYLALAYLTRGNVYHMRGQLEQALGDYSTAIHIEPDYDEAYFQRAQVLEARRRFADAEADLSMALRINPRLGQAYEARGRARAKQLKFGLAAEDISVYLKSGAARQYDNHSEMQGYLIVLQVQRVLWGLVRRLRGK